MKPRLLAAGAFVALTLAALGVRLAASPGADLSPPVKRLLGRAPRLDAYWYTRKAVVGTRGAPDERTPATFDRPAYTALCRAVFTATGATERTVALPAIAAAALTVGLLFLAGLRGGLPPGAAALGGLFAATNWIAVVHDREPLIYSTVNLAILLAVLAWAAGLRRPAFFAVGWALLALAVLTLKETALLVAPGLAAAQLAAAPTPRSRRRIALVSFVAAGAAALAIWGLAREVALAMLSKLETRTILPDLSFPGGWVATLGDLPQTLAVLGQIPAIALLALVGTAAIALEGRQPAGDGAAVFRRLLVFWLVAGCLIVAGFAYRPTRYVLCLFPPALLLAAHGGVVLGGWMRSPVACSRTRALAVLFASWWLALAALYAWLLPIAPEWLRVAFPPFAFATPFRLGVAAFGAALLAAFQASSFTERGCFPPARRYALALIFFVFLTDARNLQATLAHPTFNDRAARGTFAAIVGPGARVQGYGAAYVALAPGREVSFDFRVSASELLANESRSSHLVTLWVPELAYVEGLLAAAGAPLHEVADVVISHERYRIFRRHNAVARGYMLTAFEAARDAEQAGSAAAAARTFRELLTSQPAADPVILAYAGHAISRVDPAEGEEILARALRAAPQSPFPYLKLAELAAEQGQPERAASFRAAAATLLPHEIIAGLGRQPIPGKH
ncbi:MAG: hypothetical protein V1750_03790 [Acidobacteriota bacterium]